MNCFSRSLAVVTRIAVITVLAGTLSACGIFGGKKDDVVEVPENRTSAIGVNGFLWRAALDTLSFMPLQDVDSSGGVILSDWHVNPDAPAERVKVSVYILDERLRADGLKVQVFRQELADGIWTDAVVQAGTALRIEDAILSQARQLRIKSLGDE